MRHHFGDLLDRDDGYWTMVPNRERYAYRIEDVPAASPTVTIVTIGKGDRNWTRALTLPNLEELTLHEPTKEQLAAVGSLGTVKRLRVTHARPQTIEFIAPMMALEELVLEYVSGFSDLAPLAGLPRLRALHVENLRRVSSFGGLAGAAQLRYLAVHGTADWNQPIADFAFLRGLPGLEVLAMWKVICRAAYPALLPVLSLRNLKRLRLHGGYLAAEEYALLEEALPGVDGARWGPHRTVATSYVPLPRDDVRARLPPDVIRAHHPEVVLRFDGRVIADPSSECFEFTGKGAGRVKCSSPSAAAKCREKVERYTAMRARARALIDGRGPR